jgi:hypothetical protein
MGRGRLEKQNNPPMTIHTSPLTPRTGIKFETATNFCWALGSCDIAIGEPVRSSCWRCRRYERNFNQTYHSTSTEPLTVHTSPLTPRPRLKFKIAISLSGSWFLRYRHREPVRSSCWRCRRDKQNFNQRTHSVPIEPLTIQTSPQRQVYE